MINKKVNRRSFILCVGNNVTMNWNGTYWGLVRHIGPYEETSEDQRRANSRAGGPHAGNGNWMQTFNPSRNGDGDARVYQPEQPYTYADGAEPVVKFDVLGDPIAKVPGSRIGFGGKKKIGDRSNTIDKYTNNVRVRPERGNTGNFERDKGFIPRSRPVDDGTGTPVHMRDWTPHSGNRYGSVKPDLNLTVGGLHSNYEGRQDNVQTEAVRVDEVVERKIAKLRRYRNAHASYIIQPAGGVKRKRPATPSGAKKMKTEGLQHQAGDFPSAA